MNRLNKLQKDEAIHQYKKLADSGMDLMHMVTIKGKTNRPDINIPYHATVKLFDPHKDDPKEVHHIASKLEFNHIDPKNVHIEPSTLTGRTGYKMHVIKLHGPHAEEIEGHHKKFGHMSFKDTHEFHPHITVDEDTWHHIKNSGAKTAHEAGIEFHPPKLMQGQKTLSSYNTIKKTEGMEKGFVSHLATALGVASALAVAQPAHAPAPAAPTYSSGRMLSAISQVESSAGKDTHHKALGGIHHGESAYGKYGLTPVIIRETIHMNPDLKSKYKRAMALTGKDLHHYMHDNPGLEDTIADRHLKRLEHHFGQDPEKLGFAWNQGIRSTYKAQKQNKDIKSHWHVQKITDAYSKR
jgi:hypothetical protein